MSKIRKTITYMMLCVCIILLHSSIAHASEVERETVRVGYYPVSDYQDVNADGTYSGFSYDYYIQIQKYTRWQYEFVEASYADCMKMLANGEIDVMSGLTASPEREERFLFSEYSNSSSQSKLYARQDNENLFYESYDTFDKCRVGIISGVRTDELQQYCDNHDFSVELVTYNSYAEMEDALAKKEIDMACGASLSEKYDTKIVARLKKQPLYYAVTKSKPDIAAQLEDALQKIVDNNPEFYTQMSEKYKINGSNATATFTREEEDYIKSGKQIYLIVNNNWAPVSWLDENTGEYRGIAIDVAKEIAKYSGLSIIPIQAQEFDQMTKDNPATMGDALVLTADDTGWANSMNLMMTNHVIDSTIVMISQTGKSVDVAKEDTRIALPKNYYVSYLMKDVIANKNVQYYDTIEECLDAVNKGNADATFQNSVIARYYLSMLRYTNLYIYAESGYAENLAYGVYIDSDTPLLSILDKSLLCIGTGRIGEITVQYAHAEEPFSLEGFYYSNPILVVSIVLVFCCLIGLLIVFRLKAVNAEKRARQEKTLARFMGYVCAANEDVLEVNLMNLTAQSYKLDEQGQVQIHEFPYTRIQRDKDNGQIYPDDYDRLAENFKEESMDEMINRTGGEKYFECRAKNQDGEYHWYSYSLQAIPKDQEHPKNFILFKRNIDDAKKEEEEGRRILEDALETAKDASEAKGNFLSRVSHEIRTPLNAIIGYLSIARQPDSEQSKVAHCLENCEIASKHLLSILNDVLDMSSIESGKLTLVKEPFNLKELLQSLKTVYFQQALSKKIDFSLEITQLQQEWVVGDRVRVNQILFNLVSNAMKFTGENGQIRIKVTEMESTLTKCRIKFEVSDTGIGMSEEYMKRLFKPFEQENAKNAQKYGGTGLGLSIAWNLITMMGGSIEVNSRQGVGTTFTVLLNLEKGESPNQNKASNTKMDKLRVLLLADDKAENDIIKQDLKQAGMKCDAFEDGKKAVQRILSRKQTGYSYQLVLADISEINEAALAVIRDIHINADPKLPIVVLTKRTAAVSKQEAEKLGIMEILPKPYNQSELLTALQRLFPQNEESEETSSKRDFTGMHILLAEDNEMNREIAVEVLKRSGLSVDTAADGEEAFQKFTESEPGTYQAILMDIQMPIMDGYEATRQIRASKHVQAKNIPIIATTANAFSEDVSAALACGMNNHISKPIDYKKLYQALDKNISVENLGKNS